jgi:hypothetical protein
MKGRAAMERLEEGERGQRSIASAALFPGIYSTLVTENFLCFFLLLVGVVFKRKK